MIEEDAAATPRVGDRLKAARIDHALSLDDVAARTRIPLRHLAAIETADTAVLPAVPYAVGFVKSYARIVGLDGETLGRQFRIEMANAGEERPAATTYEPVDAARVPPRWLAIGALLIALLLALGYGLWRSGSFGGDTGEERARMASGLSPAAPVAPAAVPVAAAPGSASGGAGPAAPPPAAAPADRAVVLTASEPVWLKVYDGGRTLFIGELPAGNRFLVPADAAAPMIWTGRPQVLAVTVGGMAVPPLGPPERRIKDVSLQADALLARAGQPPTPAPGEPATALR